MRAKAVLTLECVGGPAMPTMPEREERFEAVRQFLKDFSKRFYELQRAEFPRNFKPQSDSTSGDPYTEEGERLADGVTTIFQLNSSKPDPQKGIGTLQTAANAIWGKPEYPNSRWFERERQRKYLLPKLAEWFIEYEEAYRESHPVVEPEKDDEPSEKAQDEDAPEDFGEIEPEATDEVEDVEAASDDPDDEEPIAPSAPTDEDRRRWRPTRIAGSVFAVTLIVGALVAVLILWGGGGGTASGNPAGKIRRVLNVPPSEDLAVGGGFAWLVDANDETAIRISEEDGQRTRFFVDHPPYVAEIAPRVGSRLAGYRVVARPEGQAWIVVNEGTVLSVGPTDEKITRLSRVKVSNPKAVFDGKSLWIGGFGSYPLARLDPRDGQVEREYQLQDSNSFPGIDGLAAGLGSIWAVDYVNERKAYKLTPAPSGLGLTKAIMPLKRPSDEIVAGLGAVWTLNQDGTVTRYDPSTGTPTQTIKVAGGAKALVLSRDAVWIGTGNDTLIRIEPTTLAVIGQPIKLPGSLTDLAADENVWAATDRKLVEITS